MLNKYLSRLFIASLLTIAVVIALVAGGSGDEEVAPAAPAPAAAAAPAAPAATAPPAVEVKPTLEKLNVAATTSIVADWVQQVGGERVIVEAVVPHGADAHAYQVTPKGVRMIADSDFIFGVGVEYEEKWLAKLLENYPDDRVVFLGDLVEPILFSDEHDEEEEHDEHEGHDHGQFDPHVWFDPVRVASIASIIGAELKSIDPQGSQYYEDRVKAYVEELDALHSQILAQIDEIDIHDRVIMTSHESLGYLEARYGVEVLAAVLPGLDGDISATPKDLVHAIEEIEEHNVKVIFLDETRSAKAAERVADETGVEVVSGLKVESLESGQTYIEFMEKNMNIILSHLHE